jgi:hypothetical protein
MTWEEIDNAFDDLQNRVMPDIIDDLIRKHFDIICLDISKIPENYTAKDIVNIFYYTGYFIQKRIF